MEDFIEHFGADAEVPMRVTEGTTASAAVADAGTSRMQAGLMSTLRGVRNVGR